jgi:hypothetical protein
MATSTTASWSARAAAAGGVERVGLGPAFGPGGGQLEHDDAAAQALEREAVAIDERDGGLEDLAGLAVDRRMHGVRERRGWLGSTGRGPGGSGAMQRVLATRQVAAAGA